MEHKLRNIFKEVLSITPEEIYFETSINNVPTWTSLMHFKLIASIEKEFNFKFTEDEFLHLTSFGSILKIVSNKFKKA